MTEDRHIPTRTRQPRPDAPDQPQAPALDSVSVQAAPATLDQVAEAKAAAPRKKRRSSGLSLEEQEELARQRVAQASRDLARIRIEREKHTRHLKLLLAEIVLATAKRYGSKSGTYLDKLIENAKAASVPITATDDELAAIKCLAAPQDAKKAAQDGAA